MENHYLNTKDEIVNEIKVLRLGWSSERDRLANGELKDEWSTKLSIAEADGVIRACNILLNKINID